MFGTLAEYLLNKSDDSKIVNIVESAQQTHQQFIFMKKQYDQIAPFMWFSIDEYVFS